MRRALALLWLLFPCLLAGQAYTTITATNVTVDNGSGTPVNPPSSSQLCFLGVNNAGAAITYTPSGGSPVSGTVCGTLNGSGALTGSLLVANPATASPIGLLYTITVVNGSTTYLTIPTVSLTGTVWSFDAYGLPGTGIAVGIGKPHIACSGGAQWTSTTLPPGQTSALCNTAGSWQPYPPAPYCPSGQAYLVPQSGGYPFCLPMVISGNGAPSGTCTQNSFYLQQDGGGFYGCKSTAWVLLASSTPGVNSINGATGSFIFNGTGFSSCSTVGGTTTCTFNGGASGISGQANGVIPLATASNAIGAQSHLDDGNTTGGAITSSEPLNDTSSTAGTAAGLDTNNGTSVNSITGRVSICPNVTSSTVSGCAIGVGIANSSNNGDLASLAYLYSGTPATSRGALSMGHNTGGVPKDDAEWDVNGNWYFPNLPSVPCLGTDGSGTLGSGTCGSVVTWPNNHTVVISNTTNSPNGAAGNVTGQVLVAVNGSDPVFGSPSFPTSTVTATGTLNLCDTSSTLTGRGSNFLLQPTGAITVTVPDPSNTGCGSFIAFKLSNESSNAVTVQRGTSSTFTVINGSTAVGSLTSFTLGGGQSALLSSDNTNWHVTIVQQGAGSVTDGSGTTTANQIALSTTTAHQIQYSTAIPNGTTATTQTVGDNTTKVATDAFVIANAGGGSGCPTGFTCVAPSGDTTGATDDTNISAAITAAKPTVLEAGTFYVNTTFTLANPFDILGQGNGLTTITRVSATADIFDVTDQITGGASTASGHGGIIRGFDIQQKSGVTATAGCDINLASASGAGHYVTGWHVEAVHSYNTFQSLCTGTGVITDWFSNDRAYNETGAALLYNTPLPGGDVHVDNLEASGLTTGVTINQADTFELSNLKLNGSNIKFTGSGTTQRVRIVNPSIEGATSGPTCGIDFGTGTAPTNIQVIGGAIGLTPITAPFCNLNNVTNLVYSFDNYVSGVTEGWFSNMPSTTCPAGYQSYDNFTGSGLLSALPTNCTQPWVSYGSISGNTGTLTVGSGSVTVTTAGTAGDYYVNMVPGTANYTVTANCIVSGTAVCKVLGRASTSAYTGYDAVFIGGTGFQLYKVVAGTLTQLGSTYSGVTTGTHTLALSMVGTSIQLLVDGTAQVSVTDSSISAAGVPVLGLSGNSTSINVTLFTVQ